VREAVSAGVRIRPLGVAHAWAPEVVTLDVSPRLNQPNRIPLVDTVRNTVNVEAGVRLGDLTRALAERGLALPCFLSNLRISRSAARSLRLEVRRTSRTSPSSSIARHRCICRPRTDKHFVQKPEANLNPPSGKPMHMPSIFEGRKERPCSLGAIYLGVDAFWSRYYARR
jgi:FAD binding domain